MKRDRLKIIYAIVDTCDEALRLISEIRETEKRLKKMKGELKICEKRLCYNMLCLGQDCMEYAGLEQILNKPEVLIGRLAGRYEIRVNLIG